MNPLIFVLVGLFVGALSGLVGVGGGIVLVPILVLGFGFSQHMAQGTSTAMLLPPIGVLAAWTYYQKGHVDLRVAALLCVGFVLGGWLGAKAAVAMPQAVLKRVFGGILLLISVRLLAGR